MTEELKQEAKEYAKPWKNSLAYVSIKDGYFAGAEPREKRIEELTKWLSDTSDEKLRLQMLRVDLVSKIGNQEKRIAELEQQLSAMEKGTCDVCKVKDAEFYEKRIAELEAQIEKMKCCQNCKYFECCNSNHYYCSLYCGLECEYDKTYKNWEMKEK